MVSPPEHGESPTDVLRNYLAGKAEADRSAALKYADLPRETPREQEELPNVTKPNSPKPSKLIGTAPRMKSAGDW